MEQRAGGGLIQVLVVDDSAVMRQFMSALLSHRQGMSVRVAADPVIALHKMADWRPDVVLLDLELPRMDGLSFLRRIMAHDPLPVIVVSSHVAQGSESALKALEEGAVEVVAKPELGLQDFLHESASALLETIRIAARARPQPPRLHLPVPRRPAGAECGVARRAAVNIIAAGASTGGPEALRCLLETLPLDVPGLVVVQHMPHRFIRAFAERLDRLCRIEVREASDGDRVLRGRALIAPGDAHTTVIRLRAGGFRLRVGDVPDSEEYPHRPSVDVLFRSVAKAAGADAVGILLTGMGADGAAGLLQMKRAGASTIAQDEASCVVFGMPGSAVALGAVDDVVPLGGLPAVLLSHLDRWSSTAAPAI